MLEIYGCRVIGTEARFGRGKFFARSASIRFFPPSSTILPEVEAMPGMISAHHFLDERDDHAGKVHISLGAVRQAGRDAW
jgi:hypothetical protein